MRRKQEPSLEARQASAAANVESALSAFLTVAEDLEAAVATQVIVISDANDEITRLTTVQANAQRSADAAASAAAKIRELVS